MYDCHDDPMMHEAKTNMTANADTAVSVIVPVNVGSKIDPLPQIYGEYRDQIARLGRPFEFLFVVEGDNEDAYEELRRLKSEGEPVRMIRLSQSYGDATNLTVGFDNTRYDTIVTLPAYHQIEPSSIPDIVRSLGDHDVVVVQRWPKTDSAVKHLQTRVFHKLLRITVDAPFHDLGCGIRVIRRRVIESVHIYGHKHWFLPVLARRLGFRVVETKARQFETKSGTRYFRTGIYVRRLLDLLSIFFLVRFTKKPLRFFGITGLVVFAGGALFTAYLAFQRLFMGVALADRPALLLGILLMVFGIQIFAIGLIGELIIFTHAKDLQDYVVEEIVD